MLFYRRRTVASRLGPVAAEVLLRSLVAGEILPRKAVSSPIDGPVDDRSRILIRQVVLQSRVNAVGGDAPQFLMKSTKHRAPANRFPINVMIAGDAPDISFSARGSVAYPPEPFLRYRELFSRAAERNVSGDQHASQIT